MSPGTRCYASRDGAMVSKILQGRINSISSQEVPRSNGQKWLSYLLLLRESQLLNYRIYFQGQTMKLENSKGNSTFVT